MTEPVGQSPERDYERLSELRDAIIDAVLEPDGGGGLKAFTAYEDFLHAEAATKDWLVCSSCNGLVPQRDATVICIECGEGMVWTANAALANPDTGS